jgi:hypothetical protein
MQVRISLPPLCSKASLRRLSLTRVDSNGRTGLPAGNDRLVSLSDVRVVALRVTADYGVCHCRTRKSSERRRYNS